MINPEAGHIYHWKRRDTVIRRTVLALCAALLTSFLLCRYVPWPFLSEGRALQQRSYQRIQNSQSIQPVIVVTADQLPPHAITPHTGPASPQQQQERVYAQLHQQLTRSMDAALEELAALEPQHVPRYLSLPFDLPRLSVQHTVQPLLPPRRADTPLPTTLPQVAFSLQADLSPSMPGFTLSPPALTNLGDLDLQFTYILNVAPNGALQYALPLSQTTPPQQLQQWVNTLHFPAQLDGTEKPREYELTLRICPEES